MHISESRKTVLKNLLTGQQGRNRLRKQTYGRRERGGEGEMSGQSNMESCATICKLDRQPTGICRTSQETQTGALYQPGGGVGEGDGREIQEVGVVCIPMADSR